MKLSNLSIPMKFTNANKHARCETTSSATTLLPAMSSQKPPLAHCTNEIQGLLRMPVLDWLKQVRLSHHRHIVKNLEDFGVSLVEDFEHMEEKEFDFAIKNSDFSLKTI